MPPITAGPTSMIPIHDAVDHYDNWLRTQCRVVEDGLDAKHERMRKSAFDFLRATYFRWAQTIEATCPELADAPRVGAIGDIHVENFGTWRDADARLVWGVNDFDEASVMPYAYDLVRLTTSATLAPKVAIASAAIASAVLDGYRDGLATPRPFLLDERAHWLRPFAEASTTVNRKFWRDVASYPETKPPSRVRRLLRDNVPADTRLLRFASRQKGGGGLGRPRFLLIGAWNGGSVVREAKALVPSAWDWAHGKMHRSRFIELARGSYRAPDAALRIQHDWIIRRVVPDLRKIEIDDIAQAGLTARLLRAMGADLAAIHAADGKASRIAADLTQRKAGWLHRAATAAEQTTVEDYKAFRKC